MRRLLILFFGAFFLTVVNPVDVKAAPETDCAIWLCLPAGFPSGCSAAHKAFLHRIRKGRAPLPDLASCTTGPYGEKVQGSYEIGRELYVFCDDGYVLRELDDNRGIITTYCVKEVCAPREFRSNRELWCQKYAAIRRQKPDYVKMWIDGEYLGQFFYR